MNMGYAERLTFRTIRILAGSFGISVFGFNALPHMIPRKTVEPFFRVPGLDKLPGERYKNLLQEVCIHMSIDPKKIRMFYCNGFGTVSGGCLGLPGSSVIGLPHICTLECAEDIRKVPIKFNNKQVNWNSKTGKALEDVLYLSDEQVKFLLAHELARVRDMHFIVKTLHATGMVSMSYFGGLFGVHMYKRLSPHTQKIKILRLIQVQVLMWVIGFVIYWQTRQPLNHWLRYKADESAADLSQDYCSNGIDLMRNSLKLNRILRKIYGVNGEDIFSEKGENLITLSVEPKLADRLKRLKVIQRTLTH